MKGVTVVSFKNHRHKQGFVTKRKKKEYKNDQEVHLFLANSLFLLCLYRLSVYVHMMQTKNVQSQAHVYQVRSIPVG